MKKLFVLLLLLLPSTLSAVPQHFGYEMADASDLNKDGFRDIVALCPDLQGNTGTAFLCAVSGKDKTELWSTDLGSYRIYGVVSIVATREDYDGDGVYDLAVGNATLTVGNVAVGKVFTISGFNGTILQEIPAPVINAPGSLHFGNSLVSEYYIDIDQDGWGEIFIGSPWNLPAAPIQNPLAMEKVYAISPKTGAILWEAVTPSPGNSFGWSMRLLLEDHDGDGIRDLLVGAPNEIHTVGTVSYRGAVYILSSRTGQILQKIQNPIDFGGNWGNMWFGYSLQAANDMNQDGGEDFYVGSPHVAGTSGPGTVFLFSGADFSQLCTIQSGKQLDGFGSSLAGGHHFTLGQPAFLTPIGHDLVVGAPDENGTGRFYVFRGEPGTCNYTTLVSEAGPTSNSYTANRVALMWPDGDTSLLPSGKPNSHLNKGYYKILVHSFREPGQSTDEGGIRRFSGFDGSFIDAVIKP